MIPEPTGPSHALPAAVQPGLGPPRPLKLVEPQSGFYGCLEPLIGSRPVTLDAARELDATPEKRHSDPSLTEVDGYRRPGQHVSADILRCRDPSSMITQSIGPVP